MRKPTTNIDATKRNQEQTCRVSEFDDCKVTNTITKGLSFSYLQNLIQKKEECEYELE